MKTKLALSLLIILFLAVGNSKTSAADEMVDRAAVVKSIESYVLAFNRRDAQSVSDHWSGTGEMIEPDGNRLTGREAIRDSFEKLFEGLSNEQKLSVTVDRISFVTSDVAIEEGVAYVVGGLETSYVATHKFEDGKWRIHTVREAKLPDRPSHYGHLKELEWMIGTWVDQSQESTLESSCNWSKNRNFIMKNFKVSVPGMEPLEGTQIIGYDASTGTIVSWIFDSDGGHGKGSWSRSGNTWEVRSSQVLSDGRIAESTNYYTLVDGDQFSWNSTKRRIDGENVPDTESVTVVRTQ